MNRNRAFSQRRGVLRRSAAPVHLRIARPAEGPCLDAVVRPAGESLAEATSPLSDRPAPRPVLVPLDGNPFAEHALPMAIEIARRGGAGLRLLHVHAPWGMPVDPFRGEFSSGFDYWLKQQHTSYLDAVRRRIAKISPVTVITLLREASSHPAAVIGAEAKSCDVVVMATHRRGWLGRWWNGSVAESVLRGAPNPLLLVRGREAPPDLAQAPPLERVLIPVSGSVHPEAAVAQALALGGPADAEYTVLQMTAGPHPQHGVPSEPLDGARRPLTPRLEYRGGRVRLQTLREDGALADAILWYAHHQRFDLIVLTERSRGRMGAEVIERVVRNADTPVLAAPAGS
jgi:nucleotide-binding universal stress UspA family protein